MKKLICSFLAICMLVAIASGCAVPEVTETPSASASAEVSETPATPEETPAESIGPTNSNPLSDLRVRQAIAYAIDMDAIIEGLFKGKAVAADSLMPNDDWKVDGLNMYSYDPEKAKALLQEANWDPNYTLDVVYYYGDQLTADLMATIQQYLADVGVKMTSRLLEGDVGAQLWTTPEDSLNGPSAVEWDLAYGAIAAMAPSDYYNRYESDNPINSHTPYDETLEALIEATTDPEEQKAAFMALEQYENDTLFDLPLYYQQLFVAQSDRLDRGDAEYGNEQYNYDWDIINWDIQADENGKKIMRTGGGPEEFFSDPFATPGNLMATKVLYDHLLVADGSLSVKGCQLASDYSVSEDLLTLEFTLRDDIKWHDGEAITAEDVKWTFEFAAKTPTLNAVAANTVACLKGYQDYIDGNADEITGIVIDGNKVTFNFEKEDPNMLLTFTQVPPLPKKYFEGVDPLLVQQADYFQNPVGSGPFKIEEVKIGDYATFVPFEEYYGGIAKIEEIHMYPSTPDNDPDLVKNFAAGMVDYAFMKSVDDVIALETIADITLIPVNIRYTRLIYFNRFPKE